MPLTFPRTSLRKLAGLRARERLVLGGWGMVRWLTLAVSVLVACCAIDWLVDRYGSLQARDFCRFVGSTCRRTFDMDFDAAAENHMAIRWMRHFGETPNWLRVGCSLILFGTLSVAGWFWLIRPWFQAPTMDELALRAEKAIPEFDHRLVTAIQLTRNDAQTEGMSEQLIDIVSSESESISDKHNLNRLANLGRLKRSGLLLIAPIAVFALALVGFGSERFMALAQRQAFQQVPIPRSIQIESASPTIFVSDAEIKLTFEATGDIPTGLQGTLIVLDQDGGCPEYKLVLDERTGSQRATYSATVRPSGTLRYRAWIGDGRMESWGLVALEPRPQVTIASASVAMPGYVPDLPDGSRYATEQRYGDLRLHPPSFINLPMEPRGAFLDTMLTLWDPGSIARVRVYVQKPAERVDLTLLHRPQDDESALPLRTIPMHFVSMEEFADGSQRYYYEAEFAADFEPPDGVIAANLVANCVGKMIGMRNLEDPRVNRYRVSAVDRNGFESRKDPHRSISVVPPEIPFVELLPERIPDYGRPITEEDIIKDIPVPPGAKVVIMYVCRSTMGFPEPAPGLGNRLNSPARLMVRVNEEPVPRIYLLDEIPQTDESGPYDLARSEFQNWRLMPKLERLHNGVPFHAKPGGVDKKDPSRREAGGLYFFPTEGLKKVALDGSFKDLEIGDSLEFWIEVTDRAGGRATEMTSPKRRKEIRSQEEVDRQLKELQDYENKLRSIEKRQEEQGNAIRNQPIKK